MTGAGYNASGKFSYSLNSGYGAGPTNLIPSGSFTVEAWIKVSPPSGLYVFIGEANVCWVGVENGNAKAAYGSGGTEVAIATSTAIGDNAWHHVELTVDTSTGAKLFVDGVLAGGSATTPASAGVNHSFGSVFVVRENFAGTSIFNFPGEVDEVAVWSSARHSSGFTAPTSAYAGNEANLVALWHLDNNGNDSVSTDTTAPTLTSPTGTQTGTTTASGTVSTDEGNGTLYYLATTNATETAATVKAASSQAVSGTGSQSVSFTGLTASTTYYAHYCHRDAAGNDSTVSNSASFTTASTSATAVTMSGPSGGVSGVASTNFTIGANGVITGTVIVTPSDSASGGTFTPTTVSISSGSPTGTFTYTPASVGAKTVSVTNNGGLINPSNITYTATAPALYVTVTATDTITGQNIMLLVPDAGSSHPYNASNPTPVIIYVHGAGETETGLTADSLKFTCRDALIDAGYILAGSNAHGNNWGNQSSVDDYAALEKYIRANYNVKGVALWGQSMGGLEALSVVAQGKIPLTGALLTYPVCSLANLYGLGVYTGAIDTAYGITGAGIATYANKTYGLDPALKPASAFKDTPLRFYASTVDTVVPKAANTDAMQAIVASTRTEAVIVSCTGDHGDTSHFQPSDYVAFFDRCFAATTRTITLSLVSHAGAAIASAMGLKWAFWESTAPGVLSLAPVAQGVTETTDGSGVLVISVTTKLASGAVGWLTITDSDGNPATVHKSFSGPVTVT